MRYILAILMALVMIGCARGPTYEVTGPGGYSLKIKGAQVFGRAKIDESQGNFGGVLGVTAPDGTEVMVEIDSGTSVKGAESKEGVTDVMNTAGSLVLRGLAEGRANN